MIVSFIAPCKLVWSNIDGKKAARIFYSLDIYAASIHFFVGKFYKKRLIICILQSYHDLAYTKTARSQYNFQNASTIDD